MFARRAGLAIVSLLVLACSGEDGDAPPGAATGALNTGTGSSATLSSGGTSSTSATAQAASTTHAGDGGGVSAASSGGLNTTGNEGTLTSASATGVGGAAGNSGVADNGSIGGLTSTSTGTVVATSGGTGSTGETGIFEGITEAHNQARRAVDSAEPLQDLQWSADLSTIAQDWADTLAANCDQPIMHSNNDFGENIAMQGSMGMFPMFTGVQATEGWVREIECWMYGTINGSEQCDPQCIAAQNSNGCGHYTQVVWSDTQYVGCGYATCDTSDGWFTEIWVCNYDPRGNYQGQAPY